MRLKYKKYVVLFSLGIMLIGLGTFSMLAPNLSLGHSSDKADKTNPVTFGAIQTVQDKSKEDIQSEIDTLVMDYMDAKRRVDMEAMANCVDDVKYIDEAKLLAESEYVEQYENIQCKLLDGPDEGSYRVYVYYDVKIYDIETRVPSLIALYIKYDEDAGRFIIYRGTLRSDEQKAIDELDSLPKVKELVDAVQKRVEELRSSDKQVREFYDMLESVEE